MINKFVSRAVDALADVTDGAVILVSGFGDPGMPFGLVEALVELGPRNLTIVSNNAGRALEGVAMLLKRGQVSKMICAYPRRTGSFVFEERYARGEVELELVPQGTLSERIRAAKAGIAGFYTPTAVDTVLAAGKEVREINGQRCLLEYPLHADFALIRAHLADRWGNLVYQAAQRNFGPVMAGAARRTIAEVDRMVALGELDPEAVVTPGIYVDQVVTL
ncbi:3-oxoacid CoA-transferase subunit A [Burkholderia ubonensis]|uniref:3-oxoadipate CoA-transferase n=1 Tax=Burkholderia ubonensis subsp. mesacidophila TaxID=265293 RepID=A0A2A4FE72_9BURK|nr:3-oxoacid CoA-transferase subunit A [Burkholderia ubonensis]PCE30726.1 3-oxoadipate CoA-transferase [Burkholderia ubonensis subsp. mesacidophila]